MGPGLGISVDVVGIRLHFRLRGAGGGSLIIEEEASRLQLCRNHLRILGLMWHFANVAAQPRRAALVQARLLQ